LWTELRRDRYDALIVHGNQFFAYVFAVIVAKLRGIAVLNRCETHLGLSRPPLRRWLRDRLLALYYSLFDAFLAIGSANRRYYESLRVPSSRIFLVPYAVDNERFMRESRLSNAERLELRRASGIMDTAPVVLFASKFSARKNPDVLLRGAAILAREGLEFHVLFVGAGELEEELKSLSCSLGLKNVIFRGFVNQADLPRIYGAADIFVLPSQNEPWGLVVNEVMCAGRPIVVSAAVGCAEDLVRHGVNGLVLDDPSPEALANALRPLIKDAETRSAMGAESERIIRGWDFESCRKGIRQAIEQILDPSTTVQP
jgi:glycosyltransferase involved in cell wall biosynthesis